MRPIYLSSPHMSGKELEYIKKVFDSNYIAPLGEYVDRFEESIKSYTKTKNALAVVNATSALHLALRVLGVKSDDKVLASSFTFIGSVSSILYQNATPVFVDSDDSWQIDLNLVEKAIKKEKPKAMIVTHLYGQMADVKELKYLSKKYGVYLVEDAAESLGATFEDKQSGTFGDMGVYSFNGNKILTTSGGGVLVSDNEEWIEKARFLSTQAKEPYLHYEHKEFGYNYRLSNVLAAIGVAQMEVLDKRVAKKREVFEWYKQELGSIDEIEFMPEIKNSKGNRWLTTLTFKQTKPQKIIEALQDINVESRPLWKPMHLQPLFKEAKCYNNEISQKLFQKGICLASSTTMTKENVKMICDTIIKTLG